MNNTLQISKPECGELDPQVQANLDEVDRALSEDREKHGKRREMAVADEERSSTKFRSLSRLLRSIGAVVLIASAATFMIQGWEGADSIYRYLSFLGFTAVLSIAGFLCGIGMREDKGARTFLAVSAAIIPVHFAQLGALLYSVIGGVQRQLPELLVFEAPSLLIAGLTTVGGIALLLPIAVLAFASLIRSEWRIVAPAYFLLNLGLLIPTRDADAAAAIGLVLLVIPAILEVKRLAGISGMRTFEGAVVRIMLFAPFATFITRGFFYDLTTAFISMLFAAAGIFLFVVVPHYFRSKSAGESAQALGALHGAAAWGVIAADLHSQLSPAYDIFMPLLALPISALLLALSFRTIGNGATYRKAAAFIAIGAVVLQLFSVGGMTSSFLCIVTAILVAAYGYSTEEKWIFLPGIAGLGFGILYHLKYAIELYQQSPWLSLAVVGIVTVLASSVIERYSPRIIKRFSGIKERVGQWE